MYDALTKKLEPDERKRQDRYYDAGESLHDRQREWAHEDAMVEMTDVSAMDDYWDRGD